LDDHNDKSCARAVGWVGNVPPRGVEACGRPGVVCTDWVCK
jgi:hypothetical protein